jgi:peptide/nickel transport system permease protein
MVVLKRVGFALTTLILVTLLTFVLIHNMPGDPLEQWAVEIVQAQGVTMEEALKMAQAMYGYDPDVPVIQRLAKWMTGLLRGDLGKSLLYRVSVNEMVVKALPWTLLVLSTSLILSFAIGVLLGTVIAWKRRTALDPIVTAYAAFTGATPDYITALVLLIVFAINLTWFPVRGAYDIGLTPGFNWPFLKSIMRHAALPVLAFTFENTAAWALAMKGSAVSVLGEDYITAARVRGLKEGRIATLYMGRNAILPLITSLAISLGSMVGGSTFIETIFSYPGIGWFFGQALIRRDYGMMQGLFLLQAAAVILANLAADLLYTRLDPRIRLEG